MTGEPLLKLGLPAKGRLAEPAADLLAGAGFTIERSGRGYAGRTTGAMELELAFLSPAQIVDALGDSEIHAGITGLDLAAERRPDLEAAKRFDFGAAAVAAAVPAAWLDVRDAADLADLLPEFQREHGCLRVATKYPNLARRFFAGCGIADYRIVESTGTTEGAPGMGLAHLVVDLVSTGRTLEANGLRMLADGTVMESAAALFRAADIDGGMRKELRRLESLLGGGA